MFLWTSAHQNDLNTGSERDGMEADTVHF